MKNLLLYIIIILIVVPLYSRTIWRDRNIYSSGDVLNVGDIVVVAVEDLSKMNFTFDVSNSSNSQLSSNPDVNITGFLPKVSSDKSVDNKDTIKLSGGGNLSVSIAASVLQRVGNGNYNIQGIKEYVFNGISSRFTVSGQIDPTLLNGRKIKSTDITNFRLNIRGSRQGIQLDAARTAPQEGETASPQLSEEEKRKIINDYLQKMINELSR